MSLRCLTFLPACDIFCRLLITFANSLDSDQDRQKVWSDLDSNCLTYFEKKKIEKKIQQQKKSQQQKKINCKKACRVNKLLLPFDMKVFNSQ